MVNYRFNKVFIESLEVNMPSEEVTSAAIEDRLAPLYEKLSIPFGTLEKLSGIRSRKLWPLTVLPSEPATVVARQAIEASGIPQDKIGAIINASVSRDYFEPATACIVHANLGMSEDCAAFDITNACIGFSNGMLTLASMIEMGVVEAGVVVSAETVTRLIENNITALVKHSVASREDLLTYLPTFTLGSGSVAYVLCSEKLSKKGHRFHGGVVKSATEHKSLCAGDADAAMADNSGVGALMRTESQKLIAAAAKLGARLAPRAFELLGWTSEQVKHIFCHQVGKQVNEQFYRGQGLDLAKEFTIYKEFGNLVSAALPSALAIGSKEKGIKSGEEVLLTAYGSGLNGMFLGITW